MMQPRVMSGAVAKPNSSAPSSAATAMSRPVRIWPSACSVVRPRRSLATSVWWVSARPSSHGRPGGGGRVGGAPGFISNRDSADTGCWVQAGMLGRRRGPSLAPSTAQAAHGAPPRLPANLMLVHLAAPVPPSWPEMSTWSAWPLTTPLATTPTPFSDTSLTEMLRAEGSRGRRGAFDGECSSGADGHRPRFPSFNSRLPVKAGGMRALRRPPPPPPPRAPPHRAPGLADLRS
jgi:hypothetical protein